MLALGLFAVPVVARAGIVITDSAAATPWTLSDGTPGTNTDGAMSGTESFTITASATNSVLIVNYTAFTVANTGLVLTPVITWNGTQLHQALAQSSTGGTNILAEVYYLFDPTPSNSGSLAISGSGRDAEVNAYTLSGVNTNINPATYGAQSGGGTVSVNLSGATPAGSFAAITSAYRLNGGADLNYATSTGPAVAKQWTFSPDPSGDVASYGADVSNLNAGAVTISQTDNAPTRNVIAAAVFQAVPVFAVAWSVSGGGSWNLGSNWGGTVPTGTGAAAQFSASDPTTAAAISLDAAITLNSLLYTNSNQITIGPGSGGSLTFAASGAALPTVTVNSGSPIISAPISLNANTAFAVASGQTLTLSGTIADGTASSGITLPAGSGTLILGGNNTYSGTTSVAGGAMNVSGSLGNTPVFVSGGTLSLQSPGAVSQNVVTVTGGGTLVETAGNALSGSAALKVGNSSAVTLSQANNYTGATSVNGGTLQLATPGTLYGGNSGNWTPANVSVSSSGMLAVNIGGSNDFTSSQAATLLTNLSTVNNNGLKAGSSFGFDTTNSGTTNSGTAAVAYGGRIADSTGPGGGSLGVTKLGVGVLSLTNASNSYSGPTLAANGELILSGANTAATVATLSAVNTAQGGTTVLSIRNAAALGSGTANSSLAPITLNATGGSLSTSILEIGAKIGADPGPYNADFSYQIVAPGNDSTGTSIATNVVAGNGQINLGFLGNSDDGAGFAALTPSTTSAPRVVALYTPTPGSTTLATIAEKTQFGQGSGDHLTMGSPTANNTLVLMNNIDFQGGPQRRFASIRGVGIVPEGEYNGAIINSAGGSNNVSFDGNGGLIFNSMFTTYTAATLQINGGAVFIGANDPAQASSPSALGEGNATIQVGTSTTNNPSGGTPVPTTAGANVAFMTYGPNTNGVNQAIQATPFLTTGRNINVGGSDVVYNSATLGGMTDDYTAMNGNIALNESPTNATTFTARNGGRVDFGGQIGGSGSVVIGNSIVEGDATTPGIAVNNNGTIVFNGQNIYTGSTTVSAGKLYVNGSIQLSSLVTVASGATLGGTGSISSPVNVSAGGILEGGQSGSGALTLGGSVTFNGAASVFVGGTLPAVGSPALVMNNTLNTNGNTVTINVASITGTGDYALIGYSGIQTSPSDTFTLGQLPNRANGALAFNNGASELDLDVTSLAAYILWTGSANNHWDTSSINWSIPGVGSTHYIDSPGDAVLFDDSAGAKTAVSINGADVHPSSVTFNNNNSTYTVSGTNAIAGGTGLQLTGTGTVVFLNTNTFTGATSIGTGATLQLGNGSAGNDGSISQTSLITDNGALIYNLAQSQSYGGAIGGTGSVELKSGVLMLTGSSTYSGNTTVNSGTLELGVGAVNKDGSLVSNVTNNGAIVFNYFGSQTYAGAISGSGSVTKIGNGTLTLAGNNTYSTPTQVTEGGLQLASQTAIQNSTLTMGQFASLTFAGGVGSFNIGGLAGSGGITLTDSDSGLVTLIVGGSAANTTFSGIISGSGSLTQAGPNSLTLTGTSSYLGGTTISGGTLAITSASSLGAAGGALSIGPATLEVAGNIADGRTINLTDPAATIQVDAGQSYNNTGTVNGFGGVLTKTGAGLLVLGGTVNSSPATAVSGGTLLANGPFSTLGTVTVSSGVFGGNGTTQDVTVLNGAKIDVSANNGSSLSVSDLILGLSSTDTSTLNFSTGNQAIPQIAIAGNLTTNGGNDSVTVNVSGAGALIGTYTLATYSGAIGTGSSAFVLGSQTGLSTRDQGALVVTSSAIDYVVTGYYPVWSGVHGSQWTATNNWVRSDTRAPTTFLPSDAVVFDDSAGTTIGGTTSVTISGTGDVSPSAVIFNNNAYNYTISGPYGISGGGALTVNGTGSVTLSSSNTYSGGTNINAGTLIASNSSGVATGSGPVNINGGTLQIGNGGATGTIGSGAVNDNSVLAFSRGDTGLVFANTISGSGSVVQTGPGMTTLTASNSYSGGTFVSGGTLSISVDANLGLVPGSVSPANITLNGGVLQFTGTTAYESATLNANRGITLGPAGGTINISFPSTGTFATNDDSTQYAGVISGTGNLTVTGGSGTNSGGAPYILELGAQNTYTGNTTINNAIVTVQNTAAGSGPNNILPTTTVLNLINNGWFNLNNNVADQTIAGLTGDSTGQIGTTNGGNLCILTIDPAAGHNYNFAGVIGGQAILGKGPGSSANVQLVIAGSGTQTLTGANTYTNSTTITSGTLQLGNGGNSGSIAGSPVTDNGVLAIDRSDTVNLSALILEGTNGTTLTGAGELLLDGPGTLILNSTNTYTGGTAVDAGTLILSNPEAIAAGTSLTVGDASEFPALVMAPALRTGAPTAAVPEPGSLLLLVAGGTLLIVVRRLRQSLGFLVRRC